MKIPRLLAAALASVAFAAHGAWPDKPITMFVAYSAGGATDLIARAIIPHLEKSLGTTIVVINKAGAGGEIGFSAIANAPPDGYTLGMINSPPVLTIPIERASPFHWTRLDLLGNLIDDPGAFTVHRDSPINTLADLIAEAKKRPGQISMATTGTGSDDHLAMVAFERLTGTKYNHIPYKGGADVRQSLTGRQIEVASMNIGEGVQGAKAGMPFKNLAQMSRERALVAPDIPTFAELGFPVEMAALRGLAAPKGLPPEVRQRLVKAIADAVASPEFRRKAAEYFNPIRYLGPEEYAAELRSGEAQFRKMWTEAPWTEK